VVSINIKQIYAIQKKGYGFLEKNAQKGGSFWKLGYFLINVANNCSLILFTHPLFRCFLNQGYNGCIIYPL
jgi:hypothetical protein